MTNYVKKPATITEAERDIRNRVQALSREDREARIDELVQLLKAREIAFAEEYVRSGFNGVEASWRSGYRMKSKSAHGQNATDLVRKPEIFELIQLLQARDSFTAREVLQRIAEWADARISDFFTIDDKGLPVLDLNLAKKRGKLHLIRSLTPGPFGWKVDLVDPQQAMMLLGKHYALFTDVQQVLNAELAVTDDIFDPEERADRIAKLFERARARSVERSVGPELRPSEDVR